ncbi:MAG: DUF4397 domain-containing protein [Acidimicrobiales bacterium]|nr:DUF4397 domain-containing protein [Acidimicrobiales bacterium]
MRRIRPAVATAAALALGLAFVGSGSPAGAQDPPSNVRIVHALDLTGDGVGGTPVTVCLNDAIVDSDFRVGESIGPVALDPGTYNVEIFGGGAPNCDGTPVLAAQPSVPSGADLTAMAAWDVTADAATIAVVSDDVACVEDGSGRVTARHAADVGTVDVLADGGVLFAGLPNLGQASGDVPAATYAVGIAPTGSLTPVIGPVDLPVPAAIDTQVYAYGGVEGPAGVFIVEAPLTVCAVPIQTTTTTAPTPTTTAAAPATVTPSFTG